jgi:hypothetical protein
MIWQNNKVVGATEPEPSETLQISLIQVGLQSLHTKLIGSTLHTTDTTAATVVGMYSSLMRGKGISEAVKGRDFN